MKKVKYLILGAGVSGLSFAFFKRNEDYIILEKDNVPGGLAKTTKRNGFIWDVAGHFFHFHSEETKELYDFLMNGKAQRMVEKKANVFFDKHYIHAPFQYNIHELNTIKFLKCLTDLYFTIPHLESNSFKEYVINRYGEGISNMFLIPYNSKLYGCDLDNLEKDSMSVFLPKLDFNQLMNQYKGEKQKTYNDTFFYPPNGCMEFVNAICEQIDTSKIHYNEKVVSIDLDKKIVVSSTEEYQYEYLINSIALNHFLELSSYDYAKKLKSNKVLVLNIGFDKESIDKTVCWSYFPGDEIFYRVGFYNNIAGTDLLSIYVEIGLSEGDSIDVEYALQKTLADLKNVNIINTHKVLAFEAIEISPAYVHITKESTQFKQQLLKELKKKNVFMIGRYARWEYSAMDDSIEQAKEISKQI